MPTFFFVVAENGHTTTTPESNAALPGDAPVTTSDTKKPTKKRKLDESPPWKSATTQTPTAFIIDGRRKSGRTNIIPPEFLAIPDNPTPTRDRRAPLRQTSEKQQKNGVSSARNASRSAAKTPASKPQANGKARNASPTRVSSRNTKTPTKPATATRSPSNKKSAPPPSSARTALKTTPTKTSTSRPKPCPAVGTRKSTRALKKAVAAAEEELADSKGDVCANGLSDGGSSFDTDGEVDLDPDVPAPKLKVKFRVPKPVITNPAHIPPPKPFASFEEFLRQEDLERDETLLRGTEEKAREEAELRNKIEHEARFGVLREENCSLFLPEKPLEPERQYGHHDHLVAHALNFRKLMFKEKKEHQELMKKRNAALMAEIKSRRPRTREEIEQEQYVENRKLFKEQISQLRRKWDEVTKARTQLIN
jgi:helicase SWR1